MKRAKLRIAVSLDDNAFFFKSWNKHVWSKLLSLHGDRFTVLYVEWIYSCCLVRAFSVYNSLGEMSCLPAFKLRMLTCCDYETEVLYVDFASVYLKLLRSLRFSSSAMQADSVQLYLGTSAFTCRNIVLKKKGIPWCLLFPGSLATVDWMSLDAFTALWCCKLCVAVWSIM